MCLAIPALIGYAINVINEEEAQETLRLLAELAEADEIP